MRTFVASLLSCVVLTNVALSQDSVVVSDRWSERKTGYAPKSCEDCFDQEFVRITLKVKQHFAGPKVPRTVVGIWAMHAPGRDRAWREKRLFVLRPIEDPKMRATLKAEYHIMAMPLSREMYCTGDHPEELGLPRETDVYSDQRGTQCFELPRTHD
jgi:hypothetical protein